MILSFAAIAFLQHFLRHSQAVKPRQMVFRKDYFCTWDEIDFYRAEIDRIEFEILQIETDCKVKDEFSDLRNASYKDYIKGLHSDLARHNERLEQLE